VVKSANLLFGKQIDIEMNTDQKETDARIIIDRLLREAGWDIEDKNQVSTEEAASDGRADYLLKDRRARPLAVIEAKKFSKDPYVGKTQAQEYAESIGAQFIFLSNGEATYFWDYKKRPTQLIPAFYSQLDLERILTLRTIRKPLSEITIPDTFPLEGQKLELFPYHKEAIKTVDKAIEGGKRKFLIEMATGTGKTILIALIMKRLFQAGLVQRVLFLVDRIELGWQAKEKFDEILDEWPTALLYGGKRKQEGQIIVGTLPTIATQLNNFTSGSFDLVVSDESHRSIYNVYSSVINYFDAYKIGLTATPSPLIDRNTYKLFDCWNERDQRGNPTFVYGIRRGIDEGYLAGYNIYRAKTKVTAEGISYQGEDYDPQDLERVINVPARNKAIVEEFKAEEDKRDPKRERKTIVFAVTKKHAAQLTRFFNQVYNDPTETYAQVITTDTPDPTALIKKFKRQDRPVIAVSVGMLDTGFDAPVVENLVMIRPTKSAILYQQMRGRGSRLSTKIGKTSFRIYDFVGNSEHFNDESYNPYEQPQVRLRRGPAVAEPDEEKEESFKQELLKRREFVQVAEGGHQDIDKIIERAVIEVGPEGEKVDVRDYKTEWEEDIKKWVQKADPLILKVKNNEALTEEEMRGLSEKLNSPEFYFNEANLRLAYDQPDGTLSEFIKVALGQYAFPTKEERVGKAFDAWIIQNNFEPAQVSLLRMIKNQYVAGAQIDVGIFNKPPFSQQGGLDRALKIFGSEKLKETLGQLSSQVLR